MKTHPHPFNGPFAGKVEPMWILLKQDTVSGSGISWDICKSATRSRLITMPAPHHSVFFTGRVSFLPPNQQRQRTEGSIYTRNTMQVRRQASQLTASVCSLECTFALRTQLTTLHSKQVTRKLVSAKSQTVDGNAFDRRCVSVRYAYVKQYTGWAQKMGPQTHDHNSVRS